MYPRMGRIIGGACLCLLLAAPGFASDSESVLVVSIDALHPAALSAKTTPTLSALMQQGQYTLNGRSVDPPKTLIAHTAMLTGLAPQQNGKVDNDWKPGDPRVTHSTLFDTAKQRGFRTAFYYAKPKLGYLVGPAVDEHAWEADDGVARASAFFRGKGRRFVFLHISGLEYAGAESGWLSPDYLAELSDIDTTLAALFEQVRQRGTYAVVVTSDHAGHERQHGTSDPEDFKLPLILISNADRVPRLSPEPWPVTNLRGLVQTLLPPAE